MAAVAHKKLSEEEKKKILQRAREELPDLDRRYRKAIGNLQRIAVGQRPAS